LYSSSRVFALVLERMLRDQAEDLRLVPQQDILFK
jgi:hypothetical protein